MTIEGGEKGRPPREAKSIDFGSPGGSQNTLNMPITTLRKMLKFNTILGITLPKQYTNALCLAHGDYVEIYLRDNHTIVLKTHRTKAKKITVDDN